MSAPLLRPGLLGLAALQPLPAPAQSAFATELLRQAEAECAELDAGGLQVEPGAVTSADLDGDGMTDDEVVDFGAISCDWNVSHWHGSAGAPLHFVLDGRLSQSWWGSTWTTVDFNDSRVILLARHGSYCDSYGAAPCVQAIVATEDGFSTVTVPDSNERSGG